MSKKKIIWIADFFVDQVSGGAEIVDSIISSFLSKYYDVEKLNSSDTETIQDKILDDQEYIYIVSNFVALTESSKQWLLNQKYFIIEHDHKYLLNRDPSVFEEFAAPENFIVNKEFYEGALKVFCQSKIHEEVVAANLQIDNTTSLGCSLWTEEELRILKGGIGVKKNGKACFMGSKNSIKGEVEARQFCEQNHLSYDMIKPSGYEDFIAQLAKYEKFIFFPKVLESFSRVAVESRILNCSLVTNDLLGCASEPWFEKIKGEDLYNFVEKKKVEILSLIHDHIKKVETGITVILNCYRRPYNLKKQIEAIRNQTIEPTQVWLWVNWHEENNDFSYEGLDIDRIFNNDYNWKFYGRFSAALLADTKYVAIFDDDTIPGSSWFSNCLDTMKSKEGILGTVGYIQTGPGSATYESNRAGWPSQTEEIVQVDYVGHAWFFKRDWLSYLWREKPPTWNNAEDIHFSYTAQKYGGVQTYCPPHPASDKSKHGSLFGYELGVDAKATSNNIAVSHKEFFTQRDYCIRKSINLGWKTVNEISA